MKVIDLKKALADLPDDMEIAIFDHVRNVKEDSGDGSTAGIYPNFEVEVISESDLPEPEDDEDEPMKPWLALSFENLYIDEEQQ